MPSIEWVVFKPPGAAQAVLVPSTAFDLKSVERQHWKHGDVIAADFSKHRSGLHHRKVWGMLRFVYESQERFDNVEALRCFLTLQTTFHTECVDALTGEVLRYPQSWAYSAMDENEFSDLHEQLYPIILRTFFPHQGVDWLKAAVNEQAFLDGLLSFFD